MSVMRQDVLEIFQNQQICMKFRQEIFSIGNYVKNFELNESHRFQDFRDTIPLALKLFVVFHPKMNFVSLLPKERLFDCFRGTPLENVPIRIVGEVISH